MVTNPFVGSAVGARYAAARPPLHAHAIALVRERTPRARRALDIGCGTGLSTRALVGAADVVVGVDPSNDMLRHAAQLPEATFVLGVAEHLPFADAVFDLVSIASAVHWFDPGSLRDVHRVLTTGGGLVIYDVWFRAEIYGVDGLRAWLDEASRTKYPSVPRNEPPDVAAAGFAPVWSEELRCEIAMTRRALVDYLMTHSERIAAVRDGLETEQEQREFLGRGLRPFFDGAATRELGFGIKVEMFTAT